MNKLFTSIAVASLSLTMAVGVGVAVSQSAKAQIVEAAAGDKILAYSASGFGSGYGVKSGTTKGTDNTTNYSWVVTAGGNNSSLGSNNKNFSNVTKLGDTYAKYGTPVSISSTTTGVSVFALTTSMTNVGSISYSGTLGKGNTQHVYALYSSDNTTFSQLTLTGTVSQGDAFSTGNTFEFATCTGYFALLFKTTATSGDWRIDSFKADFFQGATGGPETLTTPSPSYSNGVVTWSAINNASSYKVRVDEDSWTARTTSQLSYTVDSSLATSASHKVEVVAVGDGTNYVDSNAGTVVFAKLAHAGTLADPYIVADARAAIDDTTGSITLTNSYVSGIVSQVDSYSSSYKSITYWISDDGTTSNQLEAYGGKGISGADFSSIDDVQVGDEVTVTGTLTLYNTTYEFSSNNQLVAQHRPGEKSLVSISVAGPMTKTSYTTDENWSTAGITVTAHYDDNSTDDVTSSSTITFSPLTPLAMGVGTSQTLTINATYSTESDSTTQSVNVAAPVTVSYGLINSESYLSAGDKIIILDNVEESGMGLYAGTENNVKAKSITVSNHTVSSTNLGDVAVYTLEDASTGMFYLKDKDGRYLYAASSGSNHLKASSNSSDYSTNGAWSITVSSDGFASIVATNSTNRNVMRYNGSNNPPIFSCYASDSTGSAMMIYKAGHTPAAEKVLDSLTVSGTPFKTSYVVGDSFDPAGLTINAVYTDPTTYPAENVTDDVIWDTLAVGDTSVEGSYTLGDVTAKCTVSGITVTAFVGKTYNLVTNINHLTIGDKVVIAAFEYDAAISTTQNKNNRGSSVITKSGNSLTSSVDTQEFTVAAGTKEGTFSFYTGDGYIAAASSSSNNMHTIAEKSDESSFAVEISNNIATITAQGTYTHNIIKYNNSSDLFSCYESGQKTVSIYKLPYSASDYARKFISTLACDASGSTAPSSAKWDLLTVLYDDVTSDGKTTLVGADPIEVKTPSSDAEYISEAMYLYDYVIAKYNKQSEVYTPFISGRTGSGLVVGGNLLFNIDSQSTTAIIVVVALTSVTAIGAIFFIKRRKYN